MRELTQALKQNPADTETRLVLSDWYEERGENERASFQKFLACQIPQGIVSLVVPGIALARFRNLIRTTLNFKIENRHWLRQGHKGFDPPISNALTEWKPKYDRTWFYSSEGFLFRMYLQSEQLKSLTNE